MENSYDRRLFFEEFCEILKYFHHFFWNKSKKIRFERPDCVGTNGKMENEIRLYYNKNMNLEIILKFRKYYRNNWNTFFYHYQNPRLNNRPSLS